MQIQNRFISYQLVALENAAIVLDWEVYIDANDFPEYTDLRSKFLIVHVKQVQHIKEKYKNQYKTIFFGDNGRPWDHTTTDKMKKLITERVENFILTEGNDLLGKYNDPIIAQYKTGENNPNLELFGLTKDTNRSLYN